MKKEISLGTVHINPYEGVVVVELRHSIVEDDGKKEYHKSQNIDMKLDEFKQGLSDGERKALDAVIVKAQGIAQGRLDAQAAAAAKAVADAKAKAEAAAAAAKLAKAEAK